MRPVYVRLTIAAIALNLLTGCAGFGRNPSQSPAPEVSRTGGESSEQHPERRAKTSFEMSFAHGDGLTFGTARVSAAAMLPIDPPERMLLLKPFVAAHTLDAPLDTPSSLYSTGINMMWLQRLNDQTTLTIAANPSVGGDDAEFGRHLRVFAMGAVAWDWIPDELRLTAGAAWLGRRDIGVVPAAGLEWTPNEDWNVSLILPRPKVSRRLVASDTSETWLYAAGAIAGGTFDVRRADGTADELSLREFQATAGLERSSERLGRGFVEIGAGFGRELQFERRQEVVEFGPGVVLRVGLTR
jgi:hypothetical protein